MRKIATPRIGAPLTLVRWTRTLGLSALLLSLAGCDEEAGSKGEGPPNATPTEAGAPHPIPANVHEFISAEGTAGQRGGTADAGVSAASASSDEASSSARTVEEGDIYRVLGAGKLLNLNQYRGLQVIDIADVSQPRVVGRLKEAGRPVEMYVIGQRAIVLLNNWTGYYGKVASISTERRNGGLVLNVDLSDPTAPKVTDREFVPGGITTSRVTREGDRAALYIASSNWDCTLTTNRENGCASTVVQSLDVTSSDLIPRTKLDLGGYVSAVQATPNALIVARTNYAQDQPTSQVSLIDISNIDGQMVEGPQVAVSGQVRNKFNLDLSGKVLRVVSGATWRTNGQTNHLETFDTTEPGKLAAIDHCTFGDGQNLFATLFMPDRAFFVTFLRVDPFHAFALDAQGHCQERNEFVVSGWNDFFKPVFENRRLVGIGRDEQSASGNVAVSLYDTTNLDNPNPLVAREQVAAHNSYSTASSDDKAFTVLESAVSVPARADASIIETGLALIPFAAYGNSENGGAARAGVQLFTFSERTLTRRGEMNHGQPVERSFRADGAITANLGAEDLSLFDTTNPDAPVERGRVELAPSYSDVHDFGSFLVRVHDLRAAYGSWWNDPASLPTSYAEIIAKGSDPDSALPLAKLTIPAGSRTFRVGQLLVVVSTTVVQSATLGANGLPPTQSTITIYDLTDPSQPVMRSSLRSDRLLPAYGYGWGFGGYGGYRGMGCGMVYGNYYDDFSRVLPNALVFGRNLPHQESLGQYESCSEYYSTDGDSCAYRESDCSWVNGSEYCHRKVGSDVKSCEGGYSRCERTNGKVTCAPIPKPAGATQISCYTSERFRYWQSMELDVLDLHNPDAPKLSPVNFASDEEAVGLVASAQSVYFSFKKPFAMDGDPRSFSKYYFREVGLHDPANPSVGAAVNVPGQLLAANGPQLFTRDLRWGNTVAETWLHTLRRVGDQAELVASQQFAEREVTGVLVDTASRVYVAHRRLESASHYYDVSREQELDQLNIYAADNLSKLGETSVDSWSSLTQVVDGRVLFSVPGGMMIVNAQTPSAPYAQAYFPREGYFTNNLSFDGTNLYVASGPYGIHQLDATTHNLLAP